MFSFRRKPKKQPESPAIRTSPSLPELSAQGIPWPENLVDVNALSSTENAGSKAPVQGKPANGANGTISALYMSHPPSSFENRRTSAYSRTRPSQKRARNPTTFNIMVVGAQGTGKTSLLRLLLNTADISPTATADQKAKIERFSRGSPKRTETIQTASVEICESKYDRLLLTVIDTPGLDFQSGHELKLERQVTSIVKHMDTQFSDTLSEESKVVRQSKGDQHIHLCIYMIDPSSIVTASTRRAERALPSKTRSEATISYPTSGLSPVDGEDSDDEDDWNNLSVNPADIHVIRRLSKRANVLPVVARADSLTNSKLDAIKKVIKRDLDAAGLDFGVFGPASPNDKPHTNGVNGHANGHDKEEGGDISQAPTPTSPVAPEPVEERKSRGVIKLRPIRLPRRLSRSRSRADLVESANEPEAAEITDTESVASVRFSAHVITKSNLVDILPFALIAPEHAHRNRKRSSRVVPPLPTGPSDDTQSIHTDVTHSMISPSEDGHAVSIADSQIQSPISPMNGSVKNFPYLAGPPADLRGVFIRRFRWGTIDVLSPEHCDFAALRTAVMSTHMKMLKIRTKEVLYEKFRTEKLLARRATANISEDATRRLLEDLGL
ncbi:TRAFAC class TrmE-Era-EngA-EngB-Septin-like GTPase superfamily protein [Abortiporus biennis]